MNKRKAGNAKRLVITCGLTTLMLFSSFIPHGTTGHVDNPFVITAQAAETYSDNWKMDEAGTWWYYMEDGNVAKSCWVQDHGEWYLLDENGAMRTGVVRSNGGKYYLLDTVRNTGYYGRMLKNGGVYQGVVIKADTTSSSEGALSEESLQALKNKGVEVEKVINVENTKHVENGRVISENKGEQSGPKEQGGSGTKETGSITPEKKEKPVNDDGYNGWQAISGRDLSKMGEHNDDGVRGDGQDYFWH